MAMLSLFLATPHQRPARETICSTGLTLPEHAAGMRFLPRQPFLLPVCLPAQVQLRRRLGITRRSINHLEVTKVLWAIHRPTDISSPAPPLEFVPGLPLLLPRSVPSLPARER